MDLHPIFVHFPIALLTLYSFFEVIRRWTKASFWMPLRAVLVITGTLGAFVSLSTGEGAEELYQNQSLWNVLEAHALAATVTTWIFGILAACYILQWASQQPFATSLPKAIAKPLAVLGSLAVKILRSPLAPLLAIIGFLGLSLVGALGATLVYGAEFDPITSLVNRMLFGQ